MPNLTGPIAIVTGASCGIGFAVAERLVQQRARVALPVDPNAILKPRSPSSADRTAQSCPLEAATTLTIKTELCP